ncbi:MAG: tRNA pseudouridine(55) synthase TruB [Candidatus Cyclonatronum sp.]|uniref:tRNA pseudouridine(55) synthase TruB n=1 Tax=Cyclonatronum sp. TaxID=3024185 RepID=UPI0025C3134A|nr:tRNA pseudouridine(55) synthase TruB [Cyclonatronum sp.]MCC5933062.1 tRNA pseudouridine(55) synthase TruB [Balneolales bacterium]MCH8485735.1 tRNA pseudouridine(55) synthase TruB [Cyclonatronum sp.]
MPAKSPPEPGSFFHADRHTADEQLLDHDYTAGAVILLDKPGGWSSFRLVGLTRRLIGIKKVGHAGTLDPMATGLLVLCTGKATKSVSAVQDGIKVYEARVQFGASTPSYDAETEPDATSSFSHITHHAVAAKLKECFTGEIQQVPPMYSAIKIKGQRLYKLARKGLEVERSLRTVVIHKIELSSYDASAGEAELEITCSKGTYIRSLAHDLGLALGSRAHLTALRRTQIGPYSVERALTATELVSRFKADDVIDLS